MKSNKQHNTPVELNRKITRLAKLAIAGAAFALLAACGNGVDGSLGSSGGVDQNLPG